MKKTEIINSPTYSELDPNRKVVREIPSLRGENIKQFLMSDKTIQVAMYDEPVHFEKNGTWNDIDNDLYQTEEGGYKNKSNPFQVEFAADKYAEKLVQIHQDDYELSWSYLPNTKPRRQKRSILNTVQIHDHKEADFSDSEVNKQKVNSFVTYADIEPNVDLKYILRAKEVKEYIILNEKTDCETFTFFYQSNHLKAHLDENCNIQFINPDTEQQVYTLCRGFMKDASGQISNTLSYDLKETEQGYQVTLHLDKDWLNDAVRVYPVEIDPPIQASQDYFKNVHAFVDSAAPNLNNHLAAELPIGSIPEGDTYTAYLKFTGFPNLTAKDYIVDAKLDLYCLDSYYDNKTNTINIRRITSWWDSTTVTYNTRPSVCEDVESYCKVTDTRRWYSWDITNMVRDWYKTGSPNDNYGLELTSQEDAWTGYKRFLSSDYAAIADGGCPVIYFTYFNTKGLESCYSYYEQSLGRSGTCYVQHLTGTFTHVYHDVTTSSRMPIVLNHVVTNGDFENIGFGAGARLNISQTCIDLSKGVGMTDIDRQVYAMDSRYRYKYTDGDGTVIYFYQDDDGVYRDELGKGLKVELDINNCMYVIDKNQFEYGFYPSGNLYEYCDASRNIVYIEWDGALPVRMHDDYGNEVRLSYNNGMLETVTDPAGRVTRYEYLDTHLYKIIRPDGTFTQYNFYLGTIVNIHDSEMEKCIYIGSENYRVKAIRKFLKSNLDLGYVVGECFGYGVDFEYRPYSTVVRSAGANDILGDQDDILTEYQFDTFGRTTTVHTYRLDGSEDYGTQKYSYTGNTTTNSQNNNKLTQVHSGGGYACNLLTNGSFEYQQIGWSEEGWGADWVSKDTSYVEEDSYFGKTCLKKVVRDANDCKIFNSQHFNRSNGSIEGTYTLSAYMKTQDVVSENGGAFIGAYAWNNDGTEEYFHTDFQLGTSTTDVENGWSRYSVTFTITNKANSFCIMLGLDSALGTVYFDGVQLEKGTVANPYNLVENSSFERGTDYWSFSGITNSDGIVSDGYEGHGFKIQNDSYGYKEIYQTIPVKGNVNDTYIASVKLKAKSCLTVGGPRCDITLGIKYTDGSVRYDGSTVNNAIWGEWQYVSHAIVLADPDDKNKIPTEVTVYLNYFCNQNWVVFDNVQLIRDFSQSYQYDDDGNLVTTNDYVNEQASVKYNTHDKVLKMMTPGVGTYYYGYNDYIADKNLVHLLTGNGLTYNMDYNSHGDQTKVRVESSKPLNRKVDSQLFYIKCADTHKYIDVDGGIFTQNTLVNTYTLNKTDAQIWELEYYSDNVFCVRSKGDRNLALDVIWGDSANGTGLQLYAYTQYSQKFNFRENDDGTYCIIPDFNSNKCLDVDVASGRLQIWDILGGENQKFILEPVGYDSPNDYMEASAEYDQVGRVTSTSDILGVVTTNTYDDKRGTLLSSTKNNQSVHYTYDVNNDRVQSVTTQNGEQRVTNEYGYTLGALSSITHNGTTFSFEQNDEAGTSTVKVGNRLLSKKQFGPEEGKLLSLTYGNGAVMENVYDDVGRTIAKKYDGSEIVQWEYDYMGISKEIDKVNDISHSFNYDSLGRIVRHDSTQGLKSHVVYDKMNRVAKYSYSIPGESVSTEFHYNSKNNTFTGQSNHRLTTEMTVDSLNRLDMKKLMVENCTIQQEYSYIQNQTTLQTYPLVACLKTQVNDGGIQYLHHEYDSKGNLTHVYEDNADTIREYHYDDTNQLIFERNETQSASYTYDAGGNITSKTENNVTTEWLYEDEQWKDLLTSFDGQTITYDEIGNPLTYRDGMSFAWEKGRQLKQVTKADETVSYQYNSSGLRTQKISSQYGTTVFILEGDCILSSTNGAETIYFYYDENNRAIAMRVNDTMYAFEHNVHGDVVGIFDTEGNLVVKYSYNAWGVPIEIVDGNGTDVSRDRTHVANKNPYRYRGYYYDVETGLYYLKTRYYDPITCRFINADSYLQTAQGFYDKNVFSYCENDPVNRVDTEGDFWLFGVIGAVAGAIIGGVSKVVANACTGRPLQEGVIGAAVGGAVSGAIVATTGNTALASYAGSAAGSATEEIISYTWGEKELNWDNVKQSAVTVARDTAIDGTIGIVTDRAIPKLKTLPEPKTTKEFIKNTVYDSPRDFHVSTNSNIVTNGINNIAGRTEGNKQDTNYLIGLMLNSLDKVINSIFGMPLFGKPLSYFWNHR